MKLNNKKHFFNALIYDIINWTFSISTVVFLWTTSHYWCTLLCGLFVLRYIADFVFRRALVREQMEMQQKLLTQFKENIQKTETNTAPAAPSFVEDLNTDEMFDLDDMPVNNNTVNDDKKVH